MCALQLELLGAGRRPVKGGKVEAASPCVSPSARAGHECADCVYGSVPVTAQVSSGHMRRDDRERLLKGSGASASSASGRGVSGDAPGVLGMRWLLGSDGQQVCGSGARCGRRFQACGGLPSALRRRCLPVTEVGPQPGLAGRPCAGGSGAHPRASA